MQTDNFHALIRFGLGRKGGEPIPADPHGWLAAQLDGPDKALAIPGATAGDGLRALRQKRQDKGAKTGDMPVRDLFRAEQAKFFANLVATLQPFRERLVLFWANHFTVSLKRAECAATIHAYIREAIRPHVTGRFTDMAMAVMHHPAMLMYLDNQQSFGPDSPVGQHQHKGLNENLAREFLELHTVTPASGYTQADVTSFARILTGWSLEIQGEPVGFRFRQLTHEPGEHRVLGQTFPQGYDGGVAALTWLSQHPATYRNLATKLVRHFVADDPPAAAVKRIETVLGRTHGDLKAAALELTRLPEAWQPLAKLRSPADYVLAVLRAADLSRDTEHPVDPQGIIAALGQPLLSAPLPNGWPDTAAEWADSEELLRRVDWAYGFSGRLAAIDAEQLGETALGPLLSEATRDAIRHAGARRDALAMLLTSPEFLRR
jgi:uncharacterized protein (DUF1800 family)